MLAFLSLVLSFVAFTAAPPPLASLEVAKPGMVAAASIDEPDPILWLQVQRSGSVLAVHASGAVSNNAAADGVVLRSFADAPMLLAMGGEPTLTTTWRDAQGGQHTVTTPLAGATPAAVERAVKLHEELVRLMQQLHPPIVP